MRSDWASSPTRGSRFVGLDSMITTSVLGSGLREQEVKTSAKITRDHLGTNVHVRTFVPPGRNLRKSMIDGRAWTPAATPFDG